MRNQDWHTIARFESHDFVKSWYKTTHEKEPSSAKISQVNAHFVQGREYFRNSTLADMSVKPLLLYYGVLSLSRGVILLKDHSKKEESLKQSHGLEIVNWRETLKGGIMNVLELQVRATNGTFRELVAACPNKHQVDCFLSPERTKTHIRHDLGELKFASDNSLLRLDDLLSRLVHTKYDYQGVTGRESNWFPAVITVHSGETHFALFTTNVPDDLQEIIDEKTVFVQPTLKSWPNSSIHDFASVSLVFRHQAGNAHQKKFPLFHNTKSQQFMTVFLDFPNKDKMSEFLQALLNVVRLGYARTILSIQVV